GHGEVSPAASPATRAAVAPSPDLPGLVVAKADDIARRIPRHLALYRPAHNPRVLILDFPDLAAQARTLNRIAVLAEMKGAPRDQVPNDAEIRRLIADAGQSYDQFYLGHDYDAATLARFFNLARGGGLSAEERRLLDILLRSRVLRVTEAGFVAQRPDQALISLAATGGPTDADIALRREILRHELAHGEFFTHLFYRAACDGFWHRGLNGYQRGLFLRFLDRAGYDIGNPALVINEVQAYLGFSEDPEVFGADALGVDDIALAELKQRLDAAMHGRPAF
ncbi:hypothetical protein, partial [Zavarzinia sp.]|uniref:hypothetical protein n=1 Tax=Zavarzinia sp. TaxID=2027920 RepID=UPI003BB655EA